MAAAAAWQRWWQSGRDSSAAVARAARQCYLLKNLLSSEELGDQRRRSRASPNPWLIGLCFDVVIGSKSVLMTFNLS